MPSEANPYAAPQLATKGEPTALPEDPAGGATYEFVIDEPYVRTAMRLHISTQKSWVGLVVFLGSIVSLVSLVALCEEPPWLGLAVALWLNFAGAALAVFARATKRKQIASLPSLGTVCRIVLSDGGVGATSPNGAAQNKWLAYSHACRMKEGFLLYQGLTQANWLPDDALKSGSVERVRELFNTHLPGACADRS